MLLSSIDATPVATTAIRAICLGSSPIRTFIATLGINTQKGVLLETPPHVKVGKNAPPRIKKRAALSSGSRNQKQLLITFNWLPQSWVLELSDTG
jgi:hypothetical protein